MKAICEEHISPVRTLIVDDAPLMRKVIQKILKKNNEIEVVGTAANGRECLDKIPRLRPDVVTLDIDMPVMNGITTVKNIMVRHQIPVVIISSMIQDGYFAFEALRLGVVDFIPKPSQIVAQDWGDEEELVRMRVRAASGMHINRMRRVRRRKRADSTRALGEKKAPLAAVVMGTTLAGPNTIMHIVTQLPRGFQGVIIALQEIHPQILVPFCASFNEISPLEVVPVTSTCVLRPGRLYMGSTFNGLQVDSSPSGSGELVIRATERAKYPIDKLFGSVGHLMGDRACGVLLTGVGTDGTEGLSQIKANGGLTIGQEQDCCVYPNIVEHAVRRDVVDVVLSTSSISDFLATWVQRKTSSADISNGELIRLAS